MINVELRDAVSGLLGTTQKQKTGQDALAYLLGTLEARARTNPALVPILTEAVQVTGVFLYEQEERRALRERTAMTEARRLAEEMEKEREKERECKAQGCTRRRRPDSRYCDGHDR